MREILDWSHFFRYLLLCHGDTGSLIHPHIRDAHPAKDCESLKKVFIIGGEWKIVELVDQLEHAEDPARGGGVLDGHGQHRLVLEGPAPVHTYIKPEKIGLHNANILFIPFR